MGEPQTRSIRIFSTELARSLSSLEAIAHQGVTGQLTEAERKQ
jgi:hypothetical protein